MDAFERLLREHQSAVRTFVAAWFPDLHGVDELSQRAFIWAYEHFDRFLPGTNAAAWLKEIARNVVLAELETREREARNLRRYLDVLEVRRLRERLASAPHESDLESHLRLCMEELPSESRQLLASRYDRQVPIEEIARAGHRSPGAVKVALFRLRLALRRCIEGKLAATKAQATEA